MASPLFSCRLPTEDRWRLAELTAMLGTTPSDVFRQLLRAAVPVPNPRFAVEVEPEEDEDDPSERDTLPPAADPRQLDMYEELRDDAKAEWRRL